MAQPQYTVTGDVGPELNGQTVYIQDFDTSEPIDSAVVADGRFVITSPTSSDPSLARLYIAGRRGPIFVLEPGTISFDAKGIPSGTDLNRAIADYNAAASALMTKYNSLPTDSTGMAARSAIVAEYEALASNTLKDNADNPVGYYVFIQDAYEMDAATLDKALATYPAMARYERVKDLQESLRRSEATGVGKKYTDFAVTYNGKTTRLSDMLSTSPNEVTLVDFWASWCGPCIRETRTIKKLLEKYGPDGGLKVVGVAVWDDPADTERAIATHQLPWPQIINAQSIPTDIYGISGIPHIMLIAPDGTILSRGLQGEALVSAVEQAVAKYAGSKPDSDKSAE